MHAIAACASRWVGRVALAVAAIVFAVLVIGPHTGRYRTLTVLTASMRPTYPPGSVVAVVPTPVSRVREGDVITYAIPVDDHHIVTHRVVEVVRPGVVRTKGDANNTNDPWVAELQGSTAWKVRTGVPGLGYFIQALRGPIPRILTLLLTALVGLVIGLRAIWQKPADA